MTTDPLNAAVGRIDAAVGGDSLPQPSSVTSRDLAALAAAIDRVQALIAAGAEPGPERSAAVERIADIAFVLHEREVEPSLCDALDAAVREIGDSGEPDHAGRERRDQAAELLRELSRRVSDMMAAAEAARRAERFLAAESPRQVRRHDDAEVGEGERGGLFDLDVEEDDEFARLVASITGELPQRADPENSAETTEAAPEPDAEWQEEMALSALMAADKTSESEASPPDETMLAAASPPPEVTAPDEPAAASEAPVVPAVGEMIAEVLAAVPEDATAPQADIVEDDQSDSSELEASAADEADAENAVVVESSAAVFVLEASLAAAADALAADAATGEIAADGATGESAAAESASEQNDTPPRGETIEPPLLEQPEASLLDQQTDEPTFGEFITDPLAAAFQAADATHPEEGVDHQPRAAPEEENMAVATGDEPQLVALPAPDEMTPVAVEGSALGAEQAADPSSSPQVFDFVAERTGAVDEDRGAPPAAEFDQIDPGDVEAGYAQAGHVEADRQTEPDIAALEPPVEMPASVGFDAPQPSHALLPEPEPSIDPQDDPGDLFDPMPEPPAALTPEPSLPAEDPLVPLDLSELPDQLPVPPPSQVEAAPPEAAAAAAAVPMAEAAALSAAIGTGAAAPIAPDVKSAPQAVSPRGGAPVPTLPPPRPVSNDPLSTVRALSEEEMIALFS